MPISLGTSALARGRHRRARVSRFRLPFYRKETELLHGVCVSLFVELISQWPFSVTYFLRLLLLGRV
jgi:hypothetical protein